MPDSDEKKEALIVDPEARIRALRQPLSGVLQQDLAMFARFFCLPVNRDAVLRPFRAGGHACALVYLQGMASDEVVSRFILEPLMGAQALGPEPLFGIRDRLASVGEVEEAQRFGECCGAALDGKAVLLAEGQESALILEARGYEHRPVEKPAAESVVLGPQEGFVESLRTNITLVRRILRSGDLVSDMLKIGTRLPTQVCLMYLKDAADPALVESLKRRLLSLRVPSCPGSGYLMQLIEDHPMALFPQMMETERPDRTARCLADGQLAVLVDGSPLALIAPVTLFHLMHAADDGLLRWQYGTFLRLIRLSGMLLSLFLPGIYAALTLFHPHMIPMELLTAIAESRARVPFPIPAEVLIMEFSFCLIHEAGTRIPSVIGPTIGIVGALILGQAAVSASIISPMLIIVVALTGLGNFAVPNYGVSLGVRLARLAFILLGALLGMYGLSLGAFLLLSRLASLRSLGVPFLAPAAPWRPHNPDLALRLPLWMQGRRLFLSRRGSPIRAQGPMRGWKEKRP